jgi:hypothetical protein
MYTYDYTHPITQLLQNLSPRINTPGGYISGIKSDKITPHSILQKFNKNMGL